MATLSDVGAAVPGADAAASSRPQFIAVTRERNLVVFDAATARCELKRQLGDYRVQDMAVTPDGKRVVLACYYSGQQGRTIRVHELATGEETSCRLEEAAFSACVSRDGRHALLALSNQQLEVRAVRAWTCVKGCMGRCKAGRLFRCNACRLLTWNACHVLGSNVRLVLPCVLWS